MGWHPHRGILVYKERSGGNMQIGDLVQWKGLNGHGRPWAGVGVVIDYNYYPDDQTDEALVLWGNGSSAWYFERRLITINNGGCHEQSD
jgi:hypothetical protein